MNNELYEIRERRYDLDWLRVLAFGILIFYHVGQFYVADWNWHIKSDTTSETLQYFMILVNPWRMPLLFLISGMALWFAGKKISTLGLVKLRLIRLAPPLIIGMLLIVPPQVYFQILQAEGVELSYSAFYRLYLDMGTDRFPNHHTPAGLMTWNHLWFIPYVIAYTLAFAVMKPVLDGLAKALNSIRVPLMLLYLIPVTVVTGYGVFLGPHFPQSHALVDDWYNHAMYFTLFAAGYVMAEQMQIVRMLVSSRWICLGVSLASYGLLVLLHADLLFNGQNGRIDWVARVLIQSFNGCAWLLTVMAWAAALLNRNSRALSYMNKAILPWYVLHQTLIVLLAWYLSQLGMNDGLEAAMVVAGTVVGCAAGYELIRRFSLTRFLFGLKRRPVRRRFFAHWSYSSIVPLAMRLL